jgi:hypothetical protein
MGEITIRIPQNQRFPLCSDVVSEDKGGELASSRPQVQQKTHQVSWD